MSKTKTKTTKSSSLKSKPPVKHDEVTIIYSAEEVAALSQILLFAKSVFLEMSTNYQNQGNTSEAETYQARSSISNMLLTKIQRSLALGEPLSREVH